MLHSTIISLFIYVSYLPNLPISLWTARTEAKRTAGLHFSLPYVTIRHEVGTLPPTGPQRIQAEVKEGAALIQPQPCRHVLNQSSSRNSAPLLIQCSLTGGKEGEVIVRGVLPLAPEQHEVPSHSARAAMPTLQGWREDGKSQLLRTCCPTQSLM